MMMGMFGMEGQPTETVGPFAFTTSEDDAAVGTFAWSNPDQAVASDDVYATALTLGAVTTHYLKWLQPAGMSGVPNGKKVTSLTMRIERKAGSTNPAAVDKEVKAVVGGSVDATNKADGITPYPTSDGYAVYVWTNPGWTTTQVKGADFGLVLSSVTDGAVSISVDYAEIQSLTYVV